MIKGTSMEPVWWFIYAAVPITALCLGLYAVGQQVYRQEANDPQIQMAEDVAIILESGADPQDVISPLGVDINKSLSPYVVVYDAAAKPIAGNGYLDDSFPVLPEGLLSTDKNHNYNLYEVGENRVTWQPRAGIRQALVIKALKPGEYAARYVVAGRNLRESERRVAVLSMSVLMGWIVTVGATFVLSFIGWGLMRRAK